MLTQNCQQEHDEASTSLINARPPALIARSKDIDGEGNFTFGCSFSPDGLCVLTSTAADNLLRLYNTPTCHISKVGEENDDHDVTHTTRGQSYWETALAVKQGGSIRGYAWYPLMHSHDPATCIFLSTCRSVA